MTAEVCRSSSVRVWTSDRLSLSDEGNASGFERVTMTLADVSACPSALCYILLAVLSDKPLHFAPQTSQVSVVCCRPLLRSSRFPQSVQKTSDPIADILTINDNMFHLR